MSDEAALLIERLARIVQNETHAEGLKPTQWEALRYIARANRFSRSPGALTAYLGMTKGTVSQTLLALTRKELIEKQTVAGDKRGVYLCLSAKGEKKLKSDPLLKLESAVSSLGKDAQGALCTALKALTSELLKIREGRAFGECYKCRHFRATHEDGSPHFCHLLREPLSEADSHQICLEQE